jgi:hypothetical protein
MNLQTARNDPRVVLARRVVDLGRRYAWEKVARSKAVSVRDIPATPASVTRQWLTAVLCRQISGAEVVDFTVHDGTSGTSTRWGMRVVYNAAGQAAGLPEAVWVKTTAAFSQRLILGAANVIEGEIGFYRDIRPHVELHTPHPYFAEFDPLSWRSIVVIEDIGTTRGATFLSPREELSTADLEDLLADMAVLHGRFWNSPVIDLHPRWLKTPRQHLENISNFIGMRERSEIGLRRGASAVPPALLGRYDDLWRGLERALDLASQGTRTFLHGDSHVGNTFRSADGRTGFTDWQVCVKGHWSYDVAYIMTTALTVENRRRSERELLDFYLERLAAAGGERPSSDEAWLAYRQQLFYPLFAWLLTIGRAAFQPKMQTDETSLALIERTATAIDDLDAFAAVGL